MRKAKQILLVLALAALPTLWGARAAHADSNTTMTFQLLGKTYCLGHAPATMHCDVRVAPLAPKAVTWMGKTWCFGDAEHARCDVRVAPFAPSPSPIPRAAQWIESLRERLRTNGPNHATK